MRKIVILLSAMLFMVACEKGNEEVKEAKVVVIGAASLLHHESQESLRLRCKPFFLW